MSHKPAIRVLELLSSVPWALTEDVLRTMTEIASRENLSPEAVAAQLGRPLDHARAAVQVRGGVAVVPVVGPIFRYSDWFTEISGGATVEEVGKDLGAALRDPSVRAILLNIDSPGGEANGVAELAHMIRAAGDQKPVTAYVGGLGASGGYWLAASAQEVVTASTGILGSIGVRMAVRSGRGGGFDFVSSQSPKKRPDPATESGRAQLQEHVDALAAVFVADIARYRRVTEEKVLSDFGQGGVLVGQQAVNVGMADRLGTFEETLAGLVDQVQVSPGERDAGRAEDRKEQPMAGTRWEQFKALFGGDDEPPAAPTGTAVPMEPGTFINGHPRVAELEAQVTALTRERDDAQASLLVAVNDRLTDYLADCQRLGQGAVEAGMIADGIRAAGDYAKAKALAEEKREQVFARYPAGTSANVKSATAPPDGGQAHAGADAVLEAASSAAKDRRERAAGNGRKP